jgi:hypothetical protein
MIRRSGMPSPGPVIRNVRLLAYTRRAGYKLAKRFHDPMRTRGLSKALEIVWCQRVIHFTHNPRAPC